MRRQQPEEEALDLQCTKNKFQITAQNHKLRERTRKQRFNEVRPYCLRPRGNQREIILFWKIDYNGCSTSEYQESCYFRCYNKTLENPYKYNRFLNQQSQPATRLSVDRAVDRPHPPVDRTGRLFPTESWVTSVGRPGGRPSSSSGRPGGRSLRPMCTSVDRTGRPSTCYCGRSIGPVD